METLPSRITDRIDTSGGPTACWPWQGATFRSGGYGATWLNGSMRRVHRLVDEAVNGPIPAGVEICHACDVPACCNPAHLFRGTRQDNDRDKHRKGRHPQTVIPDEVVADIRARVAAGEAKRAVARLHGISATQVRNIVTGKQRREFKRQDEHVAAIAAGRA